MKLAHVIPNFHNPAGCTLSAAKRERLVELAAEHGFWIFEDDPYRLVRFGDDELPPTMLSSDAAGRVIHASSFSKTVSPGVRVGYLAGPARADRRRSPSAARSTTSRPTCSPSRSCSSSAAPGALASATSSSSTGRSPSAATRSSRRYASRSPRPSSSSPAVATSSGSTCPRTSTRPAAARGRQARRAWRSSPARDFMLEGGGSSLRLSFASVPADRIAEGVERLARALESAQRAASPA